MLDGRESWIEIVIERPLGGGEALEGEEPVEPRTVTITGYGPRWAGGVLA
jgi:hypothetical protein